MTRPNDSDMDLIPGLARRSPDSVLDEILREVKENRRETKEVRDTLMVSTMERPCVLDTQRKHAAQIEELGAWKDRHEQRHEKEPSGPSGWEKMLEKVGEGAASSIGAGLVALVGWGVFYLVTKGP